MSLASKRRSGTGLDTHHRALEGHRCPFFVVYYAYGSTCKRNYTDLVCPCRFDSKPAHSGPHCSWRCHSRYSLSPSTAISADHFATCSIMRRTLLAVESQKAVAIENDFCAEMAVAQKVQRGHNWRLQKADFLCKPRLGFPLRTLRA